MTRIKLLRLYLLSPDGSEFFVRELTRDLDEQINSIRRELENLEKMGMLISKLRDRKKYYRIDPRFPFLSELRSMFQKAESTSLKILKKIQKMGKVDLLVLTGFFVGISSNVDLVVVGCLDKKKLSDYLSRELTEELKSEIRYSVFSQEDFLYRLECKDKFSYDLLKDPRNLVMVNKIEKKIGGVCAF
jgi:DNA-binding transcriptional ArsR family regulator